MTTAPKHRTVIHPDRRMPLDIPSAMGKGLGGLVSLKFR